MKSLVTLALIFGASFSYAGEQIATTEYICSTKIERDQNSANATIIVQSLFPSSVRNIKIAVDGKIEREELVTRKQSKGAWGEMTIVYSGNSVVLNLMIVNSNNRYSLSLDGNQVDAPLTCDQFVSVAKP